jgi:hypothetical protein
MNGWSACHPCGRHKELDGVKPRTHSGVCFAMQFSTSAPAWDGEHGLRLLVQRRCPRTARGGGATSPNFDIVRVWHRLVVLHVGSGEHGEHRKRAVVCRAWVKAFEKGEKGAEVTGGSFYGYMEMEEQRF